MAKFEINVPFETDQPTVVVEVDPRSPLARGRHKFQLEVIDDSGNVSLPDVVDVIVADRERPTAVLAGPQVADLGKNFELNGSKSFDIGGVIKTFRYTYLGPVR
jgi:hypothetical protein